MDECMRFPDTVEEFMEQYKVVDKEGIYMSKGSELVPIFRMDQWFEHEKAQLSREGTTKGTTFSCSHENDTISREDALLCLTGIISDMTVEDYIAMVSKRIRNLSPVQPEKETPKRVLWSGWKGMRDTRYKCPNCRKPVRNTDIYCHRCGQKLMFPNISFTPYVEGQKQELIVRWDDEE